MAGKPLYENVGIGTIIKRIGECLAVTGQYSSQLLLTQQTPREDECKDLCITVGSKIVIIDFKSPDKITKRYRLYNNVKIRLNNLYKNIGLDNILLGFLHAALAVNTTSNSGYYLHVATPITTIFVKLSDIQEYIQKSSLINFKNIYIRNVSYRNCCFNNNLNKNIKSEINLIRLATNPPDCANYFNIINNHNLKANCYNLIIGNYLQCMDRYENSDKCLSCGSLCDILFNIEINYDNISYSKTNVNGMSLATLLWSILNCKIGYKITNNDELKIISEFINEYCYNDNTCSNAYMLIYTPGRMLNLVPMWRPEILE